MATNNPKKGQGQQPRSSIKQQATPRNTQRVAAGQRSTAPRRTAQPQSNNLLFYGALVALLIIGGLILYSLLTGSNQRKVGDAKQTAQQVADKGISRGKAEAKIIIVEFGDFECPACAGFAQTIEPDLKTKYIDSGIAQQVWLDYPLTSVHPKALKAAQAGQCANAQGKFWEFKDKLYANQQEWVKGDENAAWKKYATDIGIDGDKLTQCVAANTYDANVQAGIKIGTDEGVGGTPSFLVNHTLMSTEFVPQLPDFDKVITAEQQR